MDIFIDSLQYYTPVLTNIILYTGVEYFRNGYFIGFFVHCIAKKLDEILPTDDKNLDKEQMNCRKDHIFYTIPLFMSIISDTFQMLYVLHKVTSSDSQLSYLNCFLLLFSAAITAGNTVNVSHELTHRLTTIEKAMGKTEQYLYVKLYFCQSLHPKYPFFQFIQKQEILKSTRDYLLMVLIFETYFNIYRMMYSHYPVFHLLSHHKNVGTEKDPIIAKKNETVFQYLPRQLLGNYILSWKCEHERLINQENVSFPYLHYKNRMIYYTFTQFAFPLLTYKIYGTKGLISYLFMIFIAILVAEIVEYLEHYGLFVNKENKVTYECAWNSPKRYTNIASFRLERHADHHVNAYKEYQISTFDYSWPLLPESYSFMIQVSTIPSLWFSIMNPRLECFLSKQQLSQEQLQKEKQSLDDFYLKQIFTHTFVFLLAIIF